MTYTNGVLRIALERNGADNESAAIATMFLPASQVTNFLNGLNRAARDIAGQIQEQSDETADQE